MKIYVSSVDGALPQNPQKPYIILDKMGTVRVLATDMIKVQFEDISKDGEDGMVIPVMSELNNLENVEIRVGKAQVNAAGYKQVKFLTPFTDIPVVTANAAGLYFVDITNITVTGFQYRTIGLSVNTGSQSASNTQSTVVTSASMADVANIPINYIAVSNKGV
ncbi:MAG: hypothetical protein FWF92_00575 [Oscillospiraceae bacterium]|nr:hypothetical protein [Oscillospiraceae bacterium]